MKSTDDIKGLYKVFEDKYGLKVGNIAQGGDEWLKIKLGIISASNASKLVAGKKTATRQTYMNQLIAQVCTGQQKDMDSAALSWGRNAEDSARAAYEMTEGTEITELPFVFKDASFREGCSPDGIDQWNTAVEIKCPFATENHISFVAQGKIKPEWDWQMQYSMRILECDTYHFVSYDPRMMKMPIAIQMVERDEEKQKKIADAVPEFIEDMDTILKKIGVAWGDQWLRK